jgi:CheY-like chemotaxis protein
MAVKERPDLILSDVMMPKISGFDMLDILRATPETREIKVIMMTALSSEDQRARGEALGANRYLVKSQVGIEDVVRTIHEVLSDTPGTAAANAATTPIVSAAAPQQPVTPVIQPQPVAVPAVNTPVPTQPVAAPVTTQPNGVPAGLTPTLTPISNDSQKIIVPEDVIVPEPVKIAPTGEFHNIQTPASQLPQPTAPFSTPAPTPLGGVVHGNLAPQAGSGPTDFASLMGKEISGTPAPAPNSNGPQA